MSDLTYTEHPYTDEEFGESTELSDLAYQRALTKTLDVVFAHMYHEELTTWPWKIRAFADIKRCIWNGHPRYRTPSGIAQVLGILVRSRACYLYMREYPKMRDLAAYEAGVL